MLKSKWNDYGHFGRNIQKNSQQPMSTQHTQIKLTNKDVFIQIQSERNPRAGPPQGQGKGHKGRGPSRSNHFSILNYMEEEGGYEDKVHAPKPQASIKETKERKELEEKMEAME